MTYETKNKTCLNFHMKMSSDSRCPRTLIMNVSIVSAHWEKLVHGLGWVEDVQKAQSNVIEGKTLYQSVLLRLLFFREKNVHPIVPYSFAFVVWIFLLGSQVILGSKWGKAFLNLRLVLNNPFHSHARNLLIYIMQCGASLVPNHFSISYIQP